VFVGELCQEVVRLLLHELQGYPRVPHELIPELEVALFHAKESRRSLQSTQCSHARRERAPAPPILRAIRTMLLRGTGVGAGALAKIELVHCLRQFKGVIHQDNPDGALTLIISLSGTRTVKVWLPNGRSMTMECKPGHVYMFNAARITHQVLRYQTNSFSLAFRWLGTPEDLNVLPNVKLPNFRELCQ
jgi:hypothetical protein